MGDFNLLLNCKLDTNSGNPVLKNKSLAKLKSESVWYSENTPHPHPHPPTGKKKKRYTFWLESAFWFHGRRLDYFFVSNILQDFAKKTDVFASFSTNRWPFTNFSHFKNKIIFEEVNVCGRVLCKWKTHLWNFIFIR